jgi:hypothetical protein
MASAVLFVSTKSSKCQGCLKYVQTNEIPIRVCLLDRPEDRKRVATGKYMKIKYVPTLMVVDKTGAAKLFEGVNKVMSILTSFVAKALPREPPPEEVGSDVFTEEVREEEEPPKKKRRSKKKKAFEDDGDDRDDTTIIYPTGKSSDIEPVPQNTALPKSKQELISERARQMEAEAKSHFQFKP